MTTSREVVSVDAWELRRLFDEHRFEERLELGELSLLVLTSSPVHPGRNQRPGAQSQLVDLYDGGLKVAECHRYLNPDDSLGASGRLDPKSLLIDNVLYDLEGRDAGPPQLF